MGQLVAEITSNAVVVDELSARFGADSFVVQGTPDDVRRETMRTIDVMKPGGGFIAGASHDYLLEETPVENVHAMFDTIKRDGIY